MTDPTGHASGHHPAGITWGDLLASLVAEHGTLTQVAWKLVEHAAEHQPRSAEAIDVASVERALRRLRTRGQRDGGAWGQRLVRVFGIPRTVEDRVRWLALYHSPFTDLPVDLCLDQLRLWDRPPMSNSRARLWVHLGFASCALRSRRLDEAAVHLERVRAALAGLGAEYDVARIEHALVEAFLVSHRAEDRDRHGPDRPDPIDACLDRAHALLTSPTLAELDRVCFAARIADQRAYQRNRAGDHAGALALYEALPAVDLHPFASYRRDAGLAYGYHRTGRTDEAIAIARRAVTHAGDGGYTRLRAMGLILLVRFTGDPAALTRARAIGTRLGDDELLARCAKLEGSVG